MRHLTRSTLAAGALKLGGLAAFQAEASVVYVDLVPDLVTANNATIGNFRANASSHSMKTP